MPGSAAPAAMRALAAAWAAQMPGADVPVGTPAKLDADSCYVSGQILEWNQAWGVTPHTGTGLDGGRDEYFTLLAVIYRRGAGATVDELMTASDTPRSALEEALRADPTLGGSLSVSGAAEIVRLEQLESLADERTRELGLQVYVACRAWIT